MSTSQLTTLWSSIVGKVQPRRPSFQRFDSSFGGLEPMPIEPSWIQEGTPTAHGITLTKSLDDNLTSGLWQCTAGKFKWMYEIDEIVHILQGEVTVRMEGADASSTLRAGDAAYFPRGTTFHWHVSEFVRKFFVVRCPDENRHVASLRRRLAL